jgi:hypothetical protein
MMIRLVEKRGNTYLGPGPSSDLGSRMTDAPAAAAAVVVVAPEVVRVSPMVVAVAVAAVSMVVVAED